MPEVSVIVPAYNAASTLPRTLDALERQEFNGEVEIVIVDNLSDDGTAQVARERGFRVVRTEVQRGPAGARNAGIAATSAPLIAFTDADCEPSPGWLSAICRELVHADLVSGPVRPHPRARRGAWDRTVWSDRGSPWFETANMGVRRAVVEQVGGFEPFVAAAGKRPLRPRSDESPLGEDTVFGWRAVRAGARTAFAADALVHHAVLPRDAFDLVAERWRARYFPALVREVPEVRSRLPLRFFLAKRTALFDLAVAGVAVALTKRTPWSLLVTLPYLRQIRRGRDLVLVAADAVTLAGLVRGSVAARCLLL